MYAAKRRFLQEPHGVTTQKTPFFIVTAVKTSNLTTSIMFEEFYLWDVIMYILIKADRRFGRTILLWS
jgi:hypothetical protein